MPPFCGVRYHLNEWGSNPVQNEKELFNLRHSSLRVTVERAFGSLKRRFKILDDATPFFPFPNSNPSRYCACLLHPSQLGSYSRDRSFHTTRNNWTPNPRRTAQEQANDHRLMVEKRKMIAERMWADRQNHHDN
jgi:hypothetical protein